MTIVTPSFPKSRPQENEKPAFSHSSGLKSAFEKLRFHISVDGKPNRRKLRFQIPPA